jgi:hypothetical protein
MNTLLLITVVTLVYNIINIVYSYNNYKKGTLSNTALTSLVFSFLLYIVVIVYYVKGSLPSGQVICWAVAYLIAYMINKTKQNKTEN